MAARVIAIRERQVAVSKRKMAECIEPRDYYHLLRRDSIGWGDLKRKDRMKFFWRGFVIGAGVMTLIFETVILTLY